MDAADVLAEMRRLRDDELPMPLTGLIAIPIGPLDDYPQGEPASASGPTDENQQTDNTTNQ